MWQPTLFNLATLFAAQPPHAKKTTPRPRPLVPRLAPPYLFNRSRFLPLRREVDILIHNFYDFVRELFPTLVGMRTCFSCSDSEAGVQHENAVIGPSCQVSVWGNGDVPVSFFFWGLVGDRRSVNKTCMTYPCWGSSNSLYSALISAYI
jgi:hypothetical protein